MPQHGGIKEEEEERESVSCAQFPVISFAFDGVYPAGSTRAAWGWKRGAAKQKCIFSSSSFPNQVR